MWQRDVVPILAGITAFLFIFNVFYTVAPYPIAPFEAAGMEEIRELAPRGYAYPGDMPENVSASTDSWKGYKVINYWYCWGYDGYNYNMTDCEPVILLIEEGEVKSVAVRAHYNWRVIEDFPEEDGRVMINFLFRWHTPQFRPPAQGKEVIEEPIKFGSVEDFNYYNIFGWTFDPVGNAFTNAVLYGLVGAFISVGVSYYSVRRRT